MNSETHENQLRRIPRRISDDRLRDGKLHLLSGFWKVELGSEEYGIISEKLEI